MFAVNGLYITLACKATRNLQGRQHLKKLAKDVRATMIHLSRFPKALYGAAGVDAELSMGGTRPLAAGTSPASRVCSVLGGVGVRAAVFSPERRFCSSKSVMGVSFNVVKSEVVRRTLERVP
jgi:hypothetical protein